MTLSKGKRTAWTVFVVLVWIINIISFFRIKHKDVEFFTSPFQLVMLVALVAVTLVAIVLKGKREKR